VRRKKRTSFLGESIKAIVVVLILIPLALNAQTIGKVSVVGADRISETLIKTASGLNEGDQFAPVLLEDAIRKVQALGFFDDVIIRGKQSGETTELEIEVVELPQVSQIVFEGNKKIKDKDLLAKADIALNDFLSPSKVYYAVRRVRDAYAEEGYPNTEVETEAVETTPGHITLTFKIDEGGHVRVGEITFYGNSAFSDGKLRRQMKTKRKSLFRSGKFSEATYREDLGKIGDFYHNEGYIIAAILDDSISTDPEKARLNIDIWVEEGEKYRFGQVSIEGNTIYDLETVQNQLTFKTGEIYNEEKLDESLAEIYFLYQEKGYIYAGVKDDRRIETDSVHLDIGITEGIQAHVRKIEIAGNTRTHEKVIRRELAIYPGEVFMRSKLMRSVRNVYYLNYFADVLPDFEILENGDVDLVLEVEEKPIGRFQIGATYNSRDGIVGNISVGWPNMLGRGWESEFTWEFGSLRKNFSISFTEPWFLNTPTTVGFDIYNSEWRWSSVYTESRTGGAVRLGRRLRWPDDYFRVYWRYKLEWLDYYDFSSSYTPTPSYDLRTMDWPRIESSTRVTIERDSRDSKMFATRGSRNRYSIDLSGDYLGGDVDYQKQDLRSEWFFALHKYLTFVLKGRAGYLSNALGDDPDDVPYGERYFLGGVSFDGQVRGYTDRSISPIDTSAAVYDSSATPDIGGFIPLITQEQYFRTGGRFMTAFSTELRIPIQRDQLYLSIFADAGSSWPDLESSDFSKLKKSAGVGMRLVIPMLGIMGIDVAYGFDEKDSNGETSGLQWHFQIGPE